MPTLLIRLKDLLKKFCLSENLLRYIGSGESLPSPYTAEEENALVSRIKDITKPLKLNFDGKSHRTAVRISDGAKMDFGKFYFAASNGIEVIY